MKNILYPNIPHKALKWIHTVAMLLMSHTLYDINSLLKRVGEKDCNLPFAKPSWLKLLNQLISKHGAVTLGSLNDPSTHTSSISTNAMQLSGCYYIAMNTQLMALWLYSAISPHLSVHINRFIIDTESSITAMSSG